MKIALLGTGSGQVHAAVYSQRPDVDEVVVFCRTPEKLAEFGEQFGLATTTDPDALVADPTVDLVDICLPHPAARRGRGAGDAGRPGRAHRAAAGPHHS